MSIRILHGDCIEVMRTLPANSVDSIVTDPPYHLTTGKKGGTGEASVNSNSPAGRSMIGTGFMGMKWDGGDIAHDPKMWAECLRVLKPGGYVLAFGGTRTFHRLAVAIEDAGFELRDTVLNMHEGESVEIPVRDCPWLLAWGFASGFPKSLDVSKAIDKAAGAERKVISQGAPVKRMIPGAEQNSTGSWIKDNGREFVPTVTEAATEAAAKWQGWGTALKPAFEPIVMARKPLIGTVAENVLKHGTGALNIDGCRIPVDQNDAYERNASGDRGHAGTRYECAEGATNIRAGGGSASKIGRWPANFTHDGSEEVVSLFPVQAGASAPVRGSEPSAASVGRVTGKRDRVAGAFHADAGSAARFFASFKSEPCQHIESFPSPAHTAASYSDLPSELDCSVLDRAVCEALPEGLRSSLRSLEPSTNATPNELRLIATSVIATIQSFAPRFWREPLPERLSLTRGPVSIAISPTPTGTMTITASHLKSDGSVADATFDITPQSLEPGEKDLRQSRSRFIYCAKASRADRHEGLEDPGPQFEMGRMPHDASDVMTARKGNYHATVKPTELMRYLVRLVTPPGGIVLDPFLGSGSTLKAAELEGFGGIGIEKEAEYIEIARKRIAADAPLFAGVME